MKILIDNEEVVSGKDFTITEEMLNTPSVILNNVYPKAWENDKDYISRFYYPKDYSKCLIYDSDENLYPYTVYGKTTQETIEGEEGTTVEGQEISITDYDSSKEHDVLVEGNTTQEGTPTPDAPIPVNVVSGDNEINVCGKNLYNINLLQSGTRAGITLTKNNDGSITINGTATSSTVFESDNFTIGENYILSGCYGGSSSTYKMDFFTNNAMYPCFNGEEVSLPSNAYGRVRIVIYSGATVNNVKIYPMLSTIGGEFQPYQSNTYNIDLPVENLLNLPNVSTTSNGITSTITNGKLKIVGTTTTNWFSICNLNIPLESGTYTFSYTNKKVNRYNLNIKYADNTTQVIYGNAYSNTPITLNQKATITAMFSDNNTTGATFDYEDYLMIEKGSKANKYTPYGTTPIELCKIGTYQDYIYKDNGSWYLHKEIGKDKLSSSNVVYHGVYDYKYQFEFTPSQTSVAKRKIYSTHFYNNTTNQWWTINNNIYLNTENVGYITSTQYTSINAFNNFTSTNNVYVYYPLATPTNTEITDTTLIEQLEALKLATSYKGQTNVSQTNNDKPFILDISALKEGSDHLVINNAGNIYAKPTMDIEGTGVVDIYLNDVQILEADLTETNNIVIDTEAMEAYNPDTNALANRQVTGDYSKIKLEPGDNDLRFSGALSKATVTKYKRWL